MHPNISKDEIYKIAVTGGAGTGKTTVCERLRKWGIFIISADELSREVVFPGTLGLQKIVDAFGGKALHRDGTLNRAMLRHLITTQKTARTTLENILHPEIVRLMHQKIKDAGDSGESVVVVEVPLLFELGLEKEFDLVVLVCLTHDLQVKRLMIRDDVTRKEAEALLRIQMPEEKKKAKSVYVIDNDGDLEQLAERVDRLYEKRIQRFEKASNSLDT
jgi:dephospho-CoA kinase